MCKTENTEVDHLRQTGERVVKMQIIWIQRAMLCFFFPLVDEGQNGEQKMRDEGRREKAMRGWGGVKCGIMRPKKHPKTDERYQTGHNLVWHSREKIFSYKQTNECFRKEIFLCSIFLFCSFWQVFFGMCQVQLRIHIFQHVQATQGQSCYFKLELIITWFSQVVIC